MTIYIDSLFFLNAVLDYLLLLLTGKITGSPLVRWRLVLSALLGGLYAVFCVLIPFPFLSHPAAVLASGVALVLVAYGHCRYLLRCVILFLALSAALGGGLYALTIATGARFIPDVPTILLCSAGTYALLSLVGRKMARHTAVDLRRVTVQIGPRSTCLTALVDSGNTLTDPMTGRGVLVAEGRFLSDLLPPDVDYLHPSQCFLDLPDPSGYRLLPYRAVGVEHGLLLAVKATLVVDRRRYPDRLVALSPTPVSDTGTYQALFYEE